MNQDSKLKCMRMSSTVSSIFLYFPSLIGLILYLIFSNDSFVIWSFTIGFVLYFISYIVLYYVFCEIEIEEQEKSLEEKKDF